MARKFEFIAVSGDDLKGDESTRRRVRSLAQADYRRRNPSTPRPPLKLELDISAWLNQRSGNSSLDARFHAHEASVPGPLGPAAAQNTSKQLACKRTGDRAVSLVSHGEQRRARLLWDHLYDGTCVVFKSMLEVGFTDVLYGSSALMQMLSTSAYHASNDKMKGGPETAESARYSIMATQSLRQQLETQRSQASIEVVVAILAFAAFAHLINDPHLIDIHLDGLSQALGRRDGLTLIDTMPSIRIMIYWVDLSSALLQDTVPRYPQPFHILSVYGQSKLAQSIINRSPPGENLLEHPSIFGVLENIRQINALIDKQYTSKGEELWGTTLFPGLNIAPALHDLMSMSRGTAEDPIQVRRGECVRLAAIIYLIQVRRKFGFDSTLSLAYSTKLMKLLNNPDILYTWGASNWLLIWTLIVGASSTCEMVQMRLEFTRMLQDCLNYSNIDIIREQYASGYGNMWSCTVMGRVLVLEQLLVSLSR